MNLKTTDVVTISGQRGTGKSTLVRMIARKARVVIIYDPMFEHSMLGVPVRKIEDIGNLERAVFQPVNDTEDVFEKFCKFIWEKRPNVIAIFDEVDEHATLYSLPASFGKLVRLGRHKGIGVIGITRRIANLNKTLPALSQHIISFRQTLPNDVQYLADFIGVETAQKLSSLPDFEYLHYDFKTATRGRTRKDPQQPEQEQKRAGIEPKLGHEHKKQSRPDTTTNKSQNSFF